LFYSSDQQPEKTSEKDATQPAQSRDCSVVDEWCWLVVSPL